MSVMTIIFGVVIAFAILFYLAYTVAQRRR